MKIPLLIPIVASMLVAFGQDEINLHNPPPLDFIDITIEDCKYDPHGIDVQFASSYEGPHVVAVFPWPVIYVLDRTSPLFSVVTSDNHVRIDGDFCTYMSGFVQVFLPDITNGYDYVSLKQEKVKAPFTGYVRTDVLISGKPSFFKRELYRTRLVETQVTNHVEYSVPTTLEERRKRWESTEWILRYTWDYIAEKHSVDDGIPDGFFYGRSNAWPINRLVSETLYSASGRTVGVSDSGRVILSKEPQSNNTTGENK